jgi:hypothetical protein
MTFEEFIGSKKFKKWLTIAVAIIILIVVFGAGVFVGLEKAKFSYRWSDNYFRNFAGPDPGFGTSGKFDSPFDRQYFNAHGLAGQIIKIDNKTITIKSADNNEKNVLVDDTTVIRKNQNNLTISDLKINDNIVVIGSPDNLGQITARLIRVVTLSPMPLNQ